MSVFEAAGLFAVQIVVTAWSTWLGARSGSPRTWAALASVMVVGGAITTGLATAHLFGREGGFPMQTVARAVSFGWALAVSVATLHHAYHRRSWELFEAPDEDR